METGRNEISVDLRRWWVDNAYLYVWMEHITLSSLLLGFYERLHKKIGKSIRAYLQLIRVKARFVNLLQ